MDTGQKLYAAYVDTKSGPTLVVIEASSPEDAQAGSGLTREQFAPATRDEIKEWDRRAQDPLTKLDLATLTALIRRRLRTIGQRRRKEQPVPPPGSDADAWRALKLSELLAKLSTFDFEEP
jgi:hypothetical protein